MTNEERQLLRGALDWILVSPKATPKERQKAVEFAGKVYFGQWKTEPEKKVGFRYREGEQ